MVHDNFGKAFCRVISNDLETVVVFRGTRDFSDWATNLKLWPKKKSEKGMIYCVHSGFDSALDVNDCKAGQSAFNYLVELLEPHISHNRKIFFTGHSLGGALAVLAAHRINKLHENCIDSIYTFGQPAVGFGGFSGVYKLGEKTYRICGGMDVVTFLPGPFYRHVGKQYWVHDGKVYTDVHWATRIVKSIILMLTSLIGDHSMNKYIRYKSFFDKEK